MNGAFDMSNAEAQKVLGVSRSTVDRMVQRGLLQVRMDRTSVRPRRVFDRMQVRDLAVRRAKPKPHSRYARKTTLRATQRALWALKNKFPEVFDELLARELEKEDRAASAPTETARTTSPHEMKGAAPV